MSDLPAKAGSVRPDDGFAMTYATAGRRAARVLGSVCAALAGAEVLVLATNPDREGEAIAWQVLMWLEERGAVGEGRESLSTRKVDEVLLTPLDRKVSAATVSRVTGPAILPLRATIVWSLTGVAETKGIARWPTNPTHRSS